jgi:coproporphyrinogen III oxidase-like Fe-S oxidoreductase
MRVVKYAQTVRIQFCDFLQREGKEVQRLVNREQDEEFIFALLRHAREIGFTSTNIDLIYGLPKQALRSVNPRL